MDFENLADLREIKNQLAFIRVTDPDELSDRIWRLVDRIQLRIDPVDGVRVAA